MNAIKIGPFAFILAAVAAFMFCVGCQNVQFGSTLPSGAAASALSSASQSSATAPNPAVPSNQNKCSPVGPSARLTKVMFLVDTSGSNAEWFTPVVGNSLTCVSPTHIGCVPATDPTKSFRLGSIQAYFNKYKASSNFQWSFIGFGGTTATGFMPGGATHAAFSANPADMTAALQAFSATQDAGGTPMGLSVEMAATAIMQDPDRLSAANPQYIVVLLTDGYPSDYSAIADAAPDLNYLLAAAPGEATLSAIYYGSQDAASASAITFLSQIASAGNGQFANVNDPSTGIDIQTVIPGQTCL